MRKIASIVNLHEILDIGKTQGKRTISNFYLSQHSCEKYIERGVLFGETVSGASIFFRQDRDFFHLYFNYCEEDSFQYLLNELPSTGTFVVDLIGRHNSQRPLVELFETFNFDSHRHLKRLKRPSSSRDLILGTSDVQLLDGSYAQQILDYLDSSFDRFSEQLPDFEDIKIALANGNILGVVRNHILAGFLYFEFADNVSDLRYWFVNQDFRDQNIGGQLLKQYLQHQGVTRTSQLWVVDDNFNALKRYEHYGYEVESLTDHVMILRRSS